MTTESRKSLPWSWLVPIALLLPAYHVLVYFMISGRLGEALIGSLVYAPAGLIEGYAFIRWLREVTSQQQRRNTLLGFVTGFMFAFFGSLLLPSVLRPAWLSATIGGAVPWIICTWIGFNRAVPPREEATD